VSLHGRALGGPSCVTCSPESASFATVVGRRHTAPSSPGSSGTQKHGGSRAHRVGARADPPSAWGAQIRRPASNPRPLGAAQYNRDGSRCIGRERSLWLATGLGRSLFEHDGQLTRREGARRSRFGAGAAPGRALGDVGLGAGSRIEGF